MADHGQLYIAGYDGSAASRRAVALAAHLAAASGGRVVALTAYPPVPKALAPGAQPRPDGDFEHALRGEAEEVLAGLDVPEVAERRAVPGSPAHALVAAAEAGHAALIAVGMTHRGALGRMAPGSVAERLLHGATCPVLVVPADAEPPPITRVGVAYNGGPDADRALHEAEALAARLDARLVVLWVAEPVFVGAAWSIPGVYGILTPEMRREYEDRLAAVTDRTGATGRLLDGAAGPELIEAAAGLDVLVCGSRSYGPLHAVLAGSVSRHLVDHAPCPVLVVPRGAAAHDRPQDTTTAEAAA